MKVALINPRGEGTRVNSTKKRLVSFYRLTFPVLAAYTPENVDLKIYEENLEKIDFNDKVDLVGITVLTSAFQRAKEISEEYRKRNVPVVFGGIHPTVMPEESKAYADTIVMGSGELAWRQLLSDFENNNLKPVYTGQPPKERMLPKRDSFNGKSFYTFETIETSRGCPNFCEHCSIPLLYEERFQQFSIDSVIEDIESIRGKSFFFVDDNLVGNSEYSKKLFERMKGLGKRWLSQAPIYIAKDDELLRLVAESGCIGLYLGLESISEESLRETNKNRVKPSEFPDLIKKVHDYGIGIEAGFMLGFDADDKSIFERTLDFVDRTEIDSPTFHIRTPYPGTRLFQRLKAENRILHQDWSKYNTGNIVYRPKQMTPEELQEGYNWINNQSHSWPRIIKRTLGSNHPFYIFVINKLSI